MKERIAEILQSIDPMIALLWMGVAAMLLVFIYLCLCAISADHEREEIQLMREIRDALPWADPLKIIMDAEYAPVFIERRRSTCRTK